MTLSKANKDDINYMDAMQNMFQAMNKDADPLVLEEQPAAPAEETAKKDDKYWSYVDSILDSFESGAVKKAPEYPKSKALPVAEEPEKEAPKTAPVEEEQFLEETLDDFEEQAPISAKKEKPKKEKSKKTNQSQKDGKNQKNKKNKKKQKKGVLPKKGDSVYELVRKFVLLVSGLVLIGCIAVFGYMLKERTDNENLDDTYAEEMMASSKAAWDDIKSKYPNVTFPEGMQVKFASLYAQNQDLAGWIRIKGLGIDYPVMRNGTLYLRHNFNQAYSAYGAPFLDEHNHIEPLDQNTTIYAHSMRRDDQMFTPLKEYKSIDGFKENPIIEYSTLYANYKFKVYAVFISNGKASGDNGYCFNYATSNFVSDEAFESFVENLDQRALYKTGVDIKKGDKLITLSTCTYDFDEARLVVVGRMVRDGEKLTVDTSKAKVNPNPRYPQAYYNIKVIRNPYEGAARWYNK